MKENLKKFDELWIGEKFLYQPIQDKHLIPLMKIDSDNYVSLYSGRTKKIDREAYVVAIDVHIRIKDN